MSATENLKKLGLTLPSIPTPVANYVPWKRDGNTIYLSGQGPRDKDGKHITGTVKVDVTVDEQGRVIAAEATSGPKELRAAAVEAAKQARFTAPRLHGQLIKIDGVLVYKFD